MKVCIIGASGKLGKYLVRHALDKGHKFVAVCRPRNVGNLDSFKDRIANVPGITNDREIVRKLLRDAAAF